MPIPPAPSSPSTTKRPTAVPRARCGAGARSAMVSSPAVGSVTPTISTLARAGLVEQRARVGEVSGRCGLFHDRHSTLEERNRLPLAVELDERAADACERVRCLVARRADRRLEDRVGTLELAERFRRPFA